MSPSRSLPLLVLLAVLGAGCGGPPGPGPVSPSELEALEQEAARAADSPDVLNRIGVRMVEAGRFGRARDLLTASLGLKPSFTAAVYLGQAFEGLRRFADAETAYRTGLSLDLSGDQRRELDRLLVRLSRTQLAEEARAAVAREAQIAQEAPTPGTIAVLPLRYVGTDQRLAPLGTGVAQLILTDLGKIAGLTLVERERVVALLDEMTMAEEGRVDPVTAVRSGRLLRAERVVVGLVRETPGGVQLEASVYRTVDAIEEARGMAEARVEQLFALQKDVVLDLVGQLGLALSPAEQRALSERPTADLQAFLAFSEGLVAQDRGDFRAAGGHFALASGRDPSFAQAARFAERNTVLLGATRLTAASLAQIANPLAASPRADALFLAVQVIAPTTAGDLALRGRAPNTTPRLPEALGQDNPSRIAIIGDIVIVIPRP